MEDDGAILRDGMSARASKTIFEARLRGWMAHVKSYAPPERSALEKAVEDTTKCAKCQGGVRAVLEDCNPSNTFAYDLDILVSINCRDAACGWTSKQWRPWVRTKPLEL